MLPYDPHREERERVSVEGGGRGEKKMTGEMKDMRVETRLGLELRGGCGWVWGAGRSEGRPLVAAAPPFLRGPKLPLSLTLVPPQQTRIMS